MASDRDPGRLIESYKHSAEAAESAGRYQEAARQYRLAARQLYECAQSAFGGPRASYIRQGDLLVQIADALDKKAQEPPKSRPAETQAPPKSETSEKTEAPRPRPTGPRTPPLPAGDDASLTVWRAERKPNISFDDIAGLDDVKQAIRERVILPRQYPELYKEYNLKTAGGVLLYGPPGTGKTMMAKAVAHEIDASFYSVRCSDIVGKFFGEAERNVKSLFETARAEKSAIIFFDEFEALATKRGGHSTVMNRLVPELLSQMDGFTADDDQGRLLILAATNRPWDIDSAFLRPPRLTQKIKVTLPDFAARLYLVEKAFRDVATDGFDAAACADRTEGANAADIVELCNQIKNQALQRAIRMQGVVSPVTADDMEAALSVFRSSVQRSDLVQLARWEESQGKG